MCMTAIGTENKRSRNDGQFSQEEGEKLVAITLHQMYPWIDPDCTNDDANSAYIAAASPDVVIGLLDRIDRLESLLRRAAITTVSHELREKIGKELTP